MDTTPGGFAATAVSAAADTALALTTALGDLEAAQAAALEALHAHHRAGTPADEAALRVSDWWGRDAVRSYLAARDALDTADNALATWKIDHRVRLTRPRMLRRGVEPALLVLAAGDGDGEEPAGEGGGASLREISGQVVTALAAADLRLTAPGGRDLDPAETDTALRLGERLALAPAVAVEPWDCPRCGRIRTTRPGRSRTAVHRDAAEGADAEPTQVCGECCTDEAVRAAVGLPLPTPDEWTVSPLLTWGS